MFVCMSTALFTILSVEISRIYGDTSSTRIASNIVQGIGFLGAGAILKDSAGLVGMTTAATIFAEAAIGMAAGAGLYAVAGSATAIVLFGLFVMAWCADRFSLRSRAMVFASPPVTRIVLPPKFSACSPALKIPAQHFRVSMTGGNSIAEFEAIVSHKQQEQIVEQLNRQGVVTEVVPLQGHHE